MDSAGGTVEDNTEASAGPGGAVAQADLDARWQFLRQEVARQLASYRRRRRRDKRKAFALQMATVTLSATVTILLGLRTSDATRAWMLNIALVLGALITVLAAAEAFFTHRRLWVLRTGTVRRLETLGRHLDFYSAGVGGRPTDPAVLGDCLAELDAIIAEDQRAWHQLRETPAAAKESAFSLGAADPTPSPSASGNDSGAPATPGV
ncbi:hypothetical protein ABH935_000674 [Catenulispora sp. GAS73]|uniref:SLATT domain-containing protein n=1 Tax=Catenulispora sp. GAS73 TaxID=3156269 RepID=UPI0035114DFE